MPSASLGKSVAVKSADGAEGPSSAAWTKRGDVAIPTTAKRAPMAWAVQSGRCFTDEPLFLLGCLAMREGRTRDGSGMSS